MDTKLSRRSFAKSLAAAPALLRGQQSPRARVKIDTERVIGDIDPLLWGNFMLMFVAMFVYLGASQEGVAAKGRLFTSGYPVRTAMITDFRTLTHGQSIRDAGNLLVSTSQHDFPVMHGDTVIGILTRSALVHAMLTHGPDAYVSGAMTREFMRVPPDMPLTEALAKLSTPGACVLVMDGEDRLVGILNSEHLSQFILLRQVSAAQEKMHRD